MARKIKYYEGDLYIKSLTDGWVNISRKMKTKKEIEYYIKGMIRRDIRNTGVNPEAKHINASFNHTMMDGHFDGHVDMSKLNTDNTVFQNGYFDTNLKWIETNDVPFSPFQIDRKYNPEAKGSELVKRFFLEVAGGDKEKMRLLFEIIGASITPKNWQVFPVLYSGHSTSGKGTLLDIIQECVGQNLTCDVKSDKWLDNTNNNFALAPIRNKLVAYIEEIPSQLGKSSSEKIKDYVDSKRYVSIERKTIDQERIINTHTYIGTSNNKITIHKIDDSIIKRMIWIPLNMNQTGKAKFTQAEIKEILNSQSDIDWITSVAMKALLKVSKRDGVRNEKFTSIEENRQFWIDAQTNSLALDVIHSDEVLTHLFESRADFIPTAVLNAAFATWKAMPENADNKVGKASFKKSLVEYISSRKLGEATEGHSHKGSERGMRIQWFKENNDYIIDPHLGKISIEEFEAIADKEANYQAELDKERGL